MDRPKTTLFLIESLDGKITTGSINERDFDKDLKRISGVKEGLNQYYELEQKTDLVSINSGKVMAKIGVNDKDEQPHEIGVSFVIIDNKPNLSQKGVEYLANWVKTLYLVTTNKSHPVKLVLNNYNNIELIEYDNKIDFEDLLKLLASKYGIDQVTIQTGGTLNAEWIRRGLIDRISIVIAPIIIGGKDTQSLVGGKSFQKFDDLKNVKVLKLINCDILKDSYIHLQYNVINDTEIEH